MHKPAKRHKALCIGGGGGNRTRVQKTLTFCFIKTTSKPILKCDQNVLIINQFDFLFQKIEPSLKRIEVLAMNTAQIDTDIRHTTPADGNVF